MNGIPATGLDVFSRLDAGTIFISVDASFTARMRTETIRHKAQAKNSISACRSAGAKCFVSESIPASL